MSSASANQYLLEIGTEELPLEFLLSAPTELADKVKAALDEQEVAYGEVTVYVTPRRLALTISDLPEVQAERMFKTKGPPIRVALDAEGKPTQAGLGFARKIGVDFDQLIQETIEGETYMVLNQTMPGRPVRELLAELLPEFVLGLSGSHFMAWGDYTVRFSRPIRWLVSLWNNTHVPLSIGPVSSDVVSYGHRVLSGGPIRIGSVDQYLALLEKDGAVLADQNRRRELIWAQLQTAAVEAGGRVAENEDLLDTVTMLVEHPSIVVGRFEERFLDIPEEVTTTVMTAHQKYFPVRNAAGSLLPCFMTVSNGRKESAEIIRHGNEKVLTARLEDARFFFTEDQKISLDDRLEALKGITFQKGLGSMYEKTERLEALSAKIAELYSVTLGLDAKDMLAVKRAARLAKADLATGMVFEFTELQGVMGSKYARLSGESDAVSKAIFEHYLPRNAGDDVAESPVGIAVSLADKLDTIVAVFSQQNAKLPSGSKDPLGLRRMANGVIQTILKRDLAIDLLNLTGFAYENIVSSVPAPADPKKGPKFQDLETTNALIQEFVLQRFRGMLLESGDRYDIIDAVLAAGNPLSNMLDVPRRIEHLKKLTLDEAQFKRVYEPANRIFRILGEKYIANAAVTDVKPDLFKDPSEKVLFEQAQALDKLGLDADYSALIAALGQLSEPVEQFFDKVMVNDPDAEVCKNRYNLLSVLNRFYLRLACFTKLVV